jgi:hypothetical protein
MSAEKSPVQDMTGPRLSTVAYAGDDSGDLPTFAVDLSAGGYSLVIDASDTHPEVNETVRTGIGGFRRSLQQELLDRFDRFLEG